MQTATSRRRDKPTPVPSPIGVSATRAAILWDESFLWGVMAFKALRDAGLSFDLIRCDQVRRGGLHGYSLVLVPGGWAHHKMAALGDDGVRAVRQFVADGGWYLGICGGAGLASSDGIGLLHVKRHSRTERVPSFSGRIRLTLSGDPLWRGIGDPVFHAWWPSQFVLDGPGVRVLAAYSQALPDAFSSDLNIDDVTREIGWERLETLYGLKLDPERLNGEPAVITGNFGAGTVILSLIHLDTVGDANGRAVLANLWECLPDKQDRIEAPPRTETSELGAKELASPTIPQLERAVEDLITVGLRNFLWYWRTPLLLQWRRGVRGLEYCTLYVLIREIAEQVRTKRTVSRTIASGISRLSTLLFPFVEQAKRLLMLERYAIMKGQLTYNHCDDAEIRELRIGLFSSSKSHGGLFKEVVDSIDSVLFELLTLDSMGDV